MSASPEHFTGGDPKICYQTFGQPTDEPLLLVMGLGGPMTWWDDGLCARISQEGFYVARFDNRDVGRSGRARGVVRRADLVSAFVNVSGHRIRNRPHDRAPYSISDMSDDAFGVMDALGWDSAHVVGMSMGGMIAQTMAVEHPERVRTLTSMSSSLGRRTVGWQDPRMILTLLGNTGRGVDAYTARSLRTWQFISSPSYPPDIDDLRRRANATYDRGVSLAGLMRQMMAVVTQPDRTRALSKLTMPVTVLHGDGDRMVHISGGRATAAAAPTSELVVLSGWGHDLPAALWDTFAESFRRTAQRARAVTD